MKYIFMSVLILLSTNIFSQSIIEDQYKNDIDFLREFYLELNHYMNYDFKNNKELDEYIKKLLLMLDEADIIIERIYVIIDDLEKQIDELTQLIEMFNDFENIEEKIKKDKEKFLNVE